MPQLASGHGVTGTVLCHSSSRFLGPHDDVRVFASGVDLEGHWQAASVPVVLSEKRENMTQMERNLKVRGTFKVA